jgi:hypothetical protein
LAVLGEGEDNIDFPVHHRELSLEVSWLVPEDNDIILLILE